MMLLTFQHYAEIPEKIHVFYDLSFDTLFSKHDALKEAYSRKKYTKYSIDVFKRRLGFFCLISYLDQKYEFSRDDFLQYVARSAEIDGLSGDSEEFCRDLLESVCIMQQDGLNINFSHRSFQEYFSAYCLARLPVEKLKTILPKLAHRRSDSVFEMLFDMMKDTFEESYVFPMIKKTKIFLRGMPKSPTALQILEKFDLKVLAEVRGFVSSTSTINSEFGRFRDITQKIYKNFYTDLDAAIPKFMEMDHKSFEIIPYFGRIRKGKVINVREGTFSSNERVINIPDLIIQTEIKEWYEKSGHASWVRERFKAFKDVLVKVPAQSRKRDADWRNVFRL